MSAPDLDPGDPVTDVPGIGPARSDDLASEGIETVEDLQRTDLTELVSVLPDNVARSVKDTVGNRVAALTTAAQAREIAQDIPGAKAKVVKTDDGKQHPKVLEKTQEQHLSGATLEIHQG